MKQDVKDILRLAGLEKQVRLIDDGKCPMCESPIVQQDLSDDLFKKEHENTGLCRLCILLARRQINV